MTNQQPSTSKQPARPISNEALFNEPFKPAWMRRQEEDERMKLELYVTKGIELEWKKAAAESRRRISERYKPKKSLATYRLGDV